ncbi:MAG: hypothetical protein OQK66_07770 [Prosthecochloris sp.]|uniref:GumC family protein n=1 Tax=Prosthecochloris sp. TaxID=290513 RepID=UPI00258E7EC9|nr:hypothetical protein [Prosthecochloris sp.]MCW8798848.1 hypothetical protein [Prosthecochloris sp.]
MLNDQAPKEALPYGKKAKPFDITGFLKRYGLLVLVIGSFLFTLAVPVVLLIGKPNYEAKALMRIDPVIPSLITKSEDPSIINYYQDYARTQAKRMMQFSVLEQTVLKLTPEEKAAILPPLLPADKCANILGIIIKVSPLNGTHLIEIKVASPKKEGLAPLLNSFMAVFLEKVRTNTQMQDNERLVYLRNKQESLVSEISSIEDELTQLTQDIYTASFTEDYNLASKKTEELQKLYVKSLGERISAENKLLETERSNTQIKALPLDAMIDEMVMDDQSLDFTSSWTYQQLQQMRSSTDGLTKNNPDRIYVEERMKGMELYETKLKDDIRANAQQILYGKREHDLEKENIKARNHFENTVGAENEILAKLEQNQKEGTRISIGMHLGQALEARLKHKRELLDRIGTRIHELEVEGKAPLRISVESPAREPDKPAGSNIKKLMFVFFALSFGSTAGLFLAYDFLDNRIRRPEDIQNAFGSPAAGIIPKAIQDTNPEKPSQPLAMTDNVRHAIQSLAVLLKREHQQHHASIILCTGVERSNGCSSIALGIAQSLSQLLPNVLLIDADLSHPSLASMTEVPASHIGLSDILTADVSWKETIQTSPENNFDLITAGKASQSDIAQQGIAPLLEEARQCYDLICIDTGPVLESTLTEHLATQADITLLIALGQSTLYRDLRKAGEQLIRLNVAAIAPVLSWGGVTKSISIDHLLKQKPDFLDKVSTRKFEDFLRSIPSARDLYGKAQKLAGTLIRKKPESSNKENQE